jgi:hypothetical protein
MLSSSFREVFFCCINNSFLKFSIVEAEIEKTIFSYNTKAYQSHLEKTIAINLQYNTIQYNTILTRLFQISIISVKG